MIKFIISIAYDNTAVDTSAQGAVTPCNAAIKDTVETQEEMHAEEEPQESPTPSAFSCRRPASRRSGPRCQEGRPRQEGRGREAESQDE